MSMESECAVIVGSVEETGGRIGERKGRWVDFPSRKGLKRDFIEG